MVFIIANSTEKLILNVEFQPMKSFWLLFSKFWLVHRQWWYIPVYPFLLFYCITEIAVLQIGKMKNELLNSPSPPPPAFKIKRCYELLIQAPLGSGTLGVRGVWHIQGADDKLGQTHRQHLK
jgi:hypothetical protein